MEYLSRALFFSIPFAVVYIRFALRSCKDSGQKLFEENPKKALQKVTFYSNSHIPLELGGLLDYYECIPQLERWLEKVEQWERKWRAEKGHPFLVINGFVKVGKSTVLDIIPDRLGSHFSNYHVCRISFDPFPRSTAYDFLSRFYANLSQWSASTLNIQVPPPLQETIGALNATITDLLKEISRQFGGPVLYLFDEVQCWFQFPQDELERAAIFAFFKDIVGNYPGQYFIVTGSGMATAWNAFFRAPPHGWNMASIITSINIPEVFPRKVLKWCLARLQLSPDYLRFVTNPAQILFIYSSLNATSQTQNLEAFIYQQIDQQYLQEFVGDMLPLLQEINDENRKLIRRVALGIAVDQSPVLFSRFFEPFLKTFSIEEKKMEWNTETNNAPLDPTVKQFYGIIPGLFTRIVQLFILPDGAMDQNTIQSWNILPISLHKWKLINILGNMSSLCENVNPFWKGQLLADPNQQITCQSIENCCKRVFTKHQYTLGFNVISQSGNPLFNYVFNYHENDKNRQIITTYVINREPVPNRNRYPFGNPRNNDLHTFDFWYCTLLKVLYNYYCHNLANHQNLMQLAVIISTECHGGP